MTKTLERSDIVGKTVTRVLLRRDNSIDGFKFVEAVVELDNDSAFCVNEAGVDEPSSIHIFDGAQNNLEVASIEFDALIGKKITHVGISDSIPTLVVICGEDVLLGSDCGPPFNSFAPSVTKLGDLVDADELVDFWDRNAISFVA